METILSRLLKHLKIKTKEPNAASHVESQYIVKNENKISVIETIQTVARAKLDV